VSARLLGALSLALATLTLAGAGLPGEAKADSPIFSYEAAPSSTQAGGHPDLAVSFEIGNPETVARGGVEPHPCLCEAAKHITAQLPAGVIGNPHATPRCTLEDFGANACPVDSQVGVVVLHIGNQASGRDGFVAALYNMVPKPGQAGLLAFPTPAFGPKPIFIEITARTEGDYGLETKTVGIPRLVSPRVVTIVTWGVPASPEHDPLRFPFGGFQQPLGADQSAVVWG
jgi:hypothetical protein